MEPPAMRVLGEGDELSIVVPSFVREGRGIEIEG